MSDAAAASTDASGRGDAADLGGLARRGLFSLGGAAISAVANLGLIVLVTRAFSQETAGHLFASTSLVVVLQAVCALGAATGCVYFVARLSALGRPHEIGRLLTIALRPVVAVSIVAAVAVFALADLIGGVIGDGEQAAGFVRALALFLPLAAVFDVLVACTQGFHTMRPTVLLEKVGRPLAQLVLVGAVALVGGAAFLPAAWMAPYAAGVVLVALALRRLLARGAAGTSSQVPADRESAPLRASRFWRFTAPRGLAATAQLAMQRLDIVIVAALLGAVEAAVYTAASRFLVLGQLGSQAVALAVQPKFSELLAHDDLESTRRVYRTSTAWVMAVTWPIHLMVAMSAGVLMTLFGAGYTAGRSSVVVLALAMLVATGCGMVTMLLLMAGRSLLNLANVAVALVLNLVLDLVLIPSLGILGAAVAWAIAIIVANLLPLWQVHRLLGLSPFGPASLRVGLLAVVCFVLVPAPGALAGSVVVVGLMLGLGLPLYAVGLVLLRRSLALDELVRSVRRRLGRR